MRGIRQEIVKIAGLGDEFFIFFFFFNDTATTEIYTNLNTLSLHDALPICLVETTEYDDIRSWILFHHERPDGNGYPEGRREDVPLEAAIIAVADAYEAMTSDRPYRSALAPEQASNELRRAAGRQFHPDVVEALLRAV